jgi:hypothetical protein
MDRYEEEVMAWLEREKQRLLKEYNCTIIDEALTLLKAKLAEQKAKSP